MGFAVPGLRKDQGSCTEGEEEETIQRTVLPSDKNNTSWIPREHPSKLLSLVDKKVLIEISWMKRKEEMKIGQLGIPP